MVIIGVVIFGEQTVHIRGLWGAVLGCPEVSDGDQEGPLSRQAYLMRAVVRHVECQEVWGEHVVGGRRDLREGAGWGAMAITRWVKFNGNGIGLKVLRWSSDWHSE